jgi:Protein of unknown function (DUF2950)
MTNLLYIMRRKYMRRSEFGRNEIIWANLLRIAGVAVLLAGILPVRSSAQQAGQKTYPTAQAASQALVDAIKTNDESTILQVLGPEGKDIISSGDAVEDAQSRSDFVMRYQEMHRLMKEPNGTTTLYVGSHNWPLPVPLVNKGGSWYFDSATAKMEILYRRVGRNEISTIRTALELVAAEKEYAASHNGEYAQKILSDPGQQNGLYWKVDAGQPQSPIGPLVASAVAEGYTDKVEGAPRTPYRGYMYGVLTQQGPHAPGGAKSYVVNGKMTGGFAFIAFPAEYKSSGVMTFVICQDGMVFRKDLGPNTEKIAKAIKAFNPDSSWKQDEDQQEESAAAVKAN